MSELTPYLSVQEAAAGLGISDDAVHALIQKQTLRAIERSDQRILIPRPAFIAYQRKLIGQVRRPLGRVIGTGELTDSDRWSRPFS